MHAYALSYYGQNLRTVIEKPAVDSWFISLTHFVCVRRVSRDAGRPDNILSKTKINFDPKYVRSLCWWCSVADLHKRNSFVSSHVAESLHYMPIGNALLACWYETTYDPFYLPNSNWPLHAQPHNVVDSIHTRPSSTQQGCQNRRTNSDRIVRVKQLGSLTVYRVCLL